MKKSNYLYRKDLLKTIVICSICLLFGVCCSIFYKSNSYAQKNETDINVNTSLKIPTQNEVLVYGYPKNERNQTYGPDIKELDMSPDLMLAINDDGVYGYVYSNDCLIESPKQIKLKGNRKNVNIPMYSHDGKTIVGYMSSN